jgi:hypothetical protein
MLGRELFGPRRHALRGRRRAGVSPDWTRGSQAAGGLSVAVRLRALHWALTFHFQID